MIDFKQGNLGNLELGIMARPATETSSHAADSPSPHS